MKILKSICLIILFSLLVARSFAVENFAANYIILQDHHSGKILYEKDADTKIYPASMTKIMTAIVTFDLLKKGETSLDEEIIVSEEAWRLSQSGYSSMFIMLNDKVTVEDLLKGIIIVSGNDACVALATGLSGSEEEFVVLMNEKAIEIGMDNTNFNNSSGINDVKNYSTVRDIMKMSRYMIENYPEYYTYFKDTTFTWDRTGGDPITQGNRNTLLYKKVGVDGIKTGYLAVEKYSLASTLLKDTRRLISVVSGFQTKSARASGSLKLLNWGFRNTETYEISKKDKTVFEMKSWLGKSNLIKTVTKENVYVTIKKKDRRNFKVEMVYKGPIIAPVPKDQEVGFLKIYNNNEAIKTIPLYTLEKYEKVNFIKSLFTSINYLIWGDV